jgi:hypothetical protein
MTCPFNCALTAIYVSSFKLWKLVHLVTILEGISKISFGIPRLLPYISEQIEDVFTSIVSQSNFCWLMQTTIARSVELVPILMLKSEFRSNLYSYSGSFEITKR